MLQPRLHGSSALSSNLSLTPLLTALTLSSKHTRLPQPTIRHASHAAQGRANGPKDSAGRRLGAKKTASEYVIPGNIIFRQRGTKWFPGENTSIGRDHTIYATEYGYVRYYKNPGVHAKRRYIGVALAKEGPGSKLPTPVNAPTRRRLGMYAAPIRESGAVGDEEFMAGHLSENSKLEKTVHGMVGHWPTNYEVGKAMEINEAKVKKFDRGDRWLAWRKRAQKIKVKALLKAARGTRKTKGKKANKGVVMKG